MQKKTALIASAFLVGVTPYAVAQDNLDKLPPKDAPKVSTIISKIETRPDFRYLESAEWDDDGYYEITYHTNDLARVEIKIDAVSGEPRE